VGEKNEHDSEGN